jgi:hypothetical protein
MKQQVKDICLHLLQDCGQTGYFTLIDDVQASLVGGAISVKATTMDGRVLGTVSPVRCVEDITPALLIAIEQAVRGSNKTIVAELRKANSLLIA